MKKHTFDRQTKGDRIFFALDYAVLVFVVLVVVYPLIYVLSCSFSDPLAVMESKVVLWPVNISLQSYKQVFEYTPIWIGFRNSIAYTVIGTSLNLVLTMLLAFPLSARELPGKKIVLGLLTFTMLFNAGTIPNYIWMRNLGLIDNFWVLILPCGLTAYNVFVTRTYMQNTLTEELREAAEIDGCSDFRFFLQIALPLSGAIVAVMMLFYGTVHWGEYFNALIYIRSKELYPLQIFLRNILIANNIEGDLLGSLDPEEAALREALQETLKYGIIVVSSLPMMLLYPFVQKFFVKGVMIGAVKG